MNKPVSLRIELTFLLFVLHFTVLCQDPFSNSQTGTFLGIPFGKSKTEVISILQIKKYEIVGRNNDIFYLSQVTYGQKIPSEAYLRFNARGYFIEGVLIFREFKDILEFESLITSKYGNPTKKAISYGTHILWYIDTYSIVLKISNGVCTIKYQDNKLCDIDMQDKLNQKLNDNI